MIFSSTVIAANGWTIWKVRPTPMAAKSVGGKRRMEFAVFAANRDRAAILLEESGDHVEDRGLAGPIGADQPKNFSLPQRETHIVGDVQTTEMLLQAIDDEDRLTDGGTLSGARRSGDAQCLPRSCSRRFSLEARQEAHETVRHEQDDRNQRGTIDKAMQTDGMCTQPAAREFGNRRQHDDAAAAGPNTVPRPPINANMAIWIDRASEKTAAGSMKVRYIAWNVPTSAVKAADTATAISRTLRYSHLQPCAADSRSRVATR